MKCSAEDRMLIGCDENPALRKCDECSYGTGAKRHKVGIILILILLLCIVGCGSRQETQRRFQGTGETLTIYYDEYNIVVDTYTDNLYLKSKMSGSALTPLYDADGKIAKVKRP